MTFFTSPKLVEVAGRKHLRRPLSKLKWSAWLKFRSEFKKVFKFYRHYKPKTLFPNEPKTLPGKFLHSLHIAYLRCKWEMFIQF